MKYLLQHIALLLTVLFLFSACIREDFSDDGGGVSEDEQIQVELFTRSYGFNTPVTRVTADEDAVGRTPWVLVFDGSGDDATFVEAAQAYTLTGVDRTFVNLTPQTGACKLLILANPVGDYYLYDGSAYDPVDDFNLKLSGKSLSDVCSTLFTGKLNNPQTEVPFLNESLQMSYVYDATNGITTGTKIENSDKSALGMIRAVAKMVVENTDSNFELEGITLVKNVPERGLLHNLNGGWPQDIGLVDYQAGSGNIAAAVDDGAGKQSTASNPIYLYEFEKTSGTYLIIQGTYALDNIGNQNLNAVPTYYKMGIVGKNESLLDILRNHEYTFTITKVKGPGYKTLDDAIVSKALNVDIDFEIKVTDTSSYEIIANNDYFLGVSNTLFMAYSDSGVTYDNAFTLVTDCTRNFVTNSLTPVNDWGQPAFRILEPDNLKISIVDNNATTLVSTNVKIEINDLSSGTSIQYIILRLGNIEKKIHIRRREALEAQAQVVLISDNWRDFTFHSASVVEEETKEWIKLAPGPLASDIRNDTDNIIVENGDDYPNGKNRIYLHISENTSGLDRTGTVFFTCKAVLEYDDVNTPEKPTTFRIKASITQKKYP